MALRYFDKEGFPFVYDEDTGIMYRLFSSGRRPVESADTAVSIWMNSTEISKEEAEELASQSGG